MVAAFAVLWAFAPGEPTGCVPKLGYELEHRRIDGFDVAWDGARGTARFVFPKALRLPTDGEKMLDAALRFVDEHRALFGVASDELVPAAPVERLGKFWLNLRQRHLGLPVLDGVVYFRVAPDGDVFLFGSRAFTAFSPPDGVARVEASDAVSSAVRSLRELELAQPIRRPELVWFPAGSTAALAWQIDFAAKPPSRIRAWVDAQNGSVLGWTNLVNFYDLSGDVRICYLPNFFDDPYDTAAFGFGRISFNYVQSTTTDEEGHYYLDAWLGYVYQPLRSWLKGLWVDVERMDGPEAMLLTYLSPPATFSWTWTDTLAIPDELNLYYHTNYIHGYYKRLDPGMVGLDYPVPARARVPDTPGNAYWDGYGTNYGAGDESTRNFALFADVIYHEYTHGVTAWIYRDAYFPYAGEPGALNEAFSDYFACTNTGYPYAGYRVPTDDTYFRSLENDLVYPDDWFGEPHYDSRMISAAFWEIRQHLYPERVGRADTIVHFTRYSCANTFDDFAVECFFTADDDGNISNGCPDFACIANSFARHGIGPGRYPNFVIALADLEDLGDGDGNFEPSEQIRMTVKIKYAQPYTRIPDFPFPPVDGVYAYVFPGDEALAVVDEYADVGAMSYGDSVLASFVLAVDEDVVPHWASVSVFVGSAVDAEVVVREFSLPVGSPQVLIVDGSGEPGLIDYYTAAFDEIPVIWNGFTATDSTPTAEVMSEYPVVLWFTGGARNCLTAQNMLEISSYLDGGGKLVLTGQDGFDDPSYSDWLAEYFGANVADDSLFALYVNGVAGDVLGDGFDLMIFGSAGANNQRSPSALDPLGGTPFATYSASGSPVAAVRYDAGAFKTVVAGFGLEAVVESGANISLGEALRRILDWLGVPIYSSCSEGLSKPRAVSLSARPTPFNDFVALRFDGPAGAVGVLRVFDPLGRVVFERELGAGDVVRWSPRGCSAGVYICRVDSQAGRAVAKVVYLK